MSSPQHIKDFVRDMFPKKETSRASTSSDNPFRDALDDAAVERQKDLRPKRDERREKGRSLRGGL